MTGRRHEALSKVFKRSTRLPLFTTWSPTQLLNMKLNLSRSNDNIKSPKWNTQLCTTLPTALGPRNFLKLSLLRQPTEACGAGQHDAAERQHAQHPASLRHSLLGDALYHEASFADSAVFNHHAGRYELHPTSCAALACSVFCQPGSTKNAAFPLAFSNGKMQHTSRLLTGP